VSVRSGLSVLVATDGSPDAQAAVAAAVTFPWPRRARASAVVARGLVAVTLSRPSALALEGTLTGIADEARAALAARWSRATAMIVDGAAAPAILSQAKRRRAGMIVVGAQGHGAWARLTMGSVSNDVVRGAPCSVLVVRGAPRPIRSVLVGIDGSARSRRAIDLLARLVPERGARVSIVRVLEPIRVPSLALLPARVRAALAAEAAALHARRLRAAEQDLAAAVRRLKRRWRTETAVRIGTPAHELLRAARQSRADLVVVGARGAGGLAGLLLGSVANTLVERSDVSVLVAR
jgi:nucleotide-binding universal stress UspA family protein